MKLRDIIKMQSPNDGSRNLFESIVATEVIAAMQDWKRTQNVGVLIGGLALSYYSVPRFTQDVDFLILSNKEIPDEVPGFKKIRNNVFQHDKTHVTIDLITPSYKNIPVDIVEKVINNSIESNDIKIATPDGIVAIKLLRLALRDKADIASLVKTGNVGNLKDYNLPEKQLKEFEDLLEIIKTDEHPS